MQGRKYPAGTSGLFARLQCLMRHIWWQMARNCRIICPKTWLFLNWRTRRPNRIPTQRIAWWCTAWIYQIDGNLLYWTFWSGRRSTQRVRPLDVFHLRLLFWLLLSWLFPVRKSEKNHSYGRRSRCPVQENRQRVPTSIGAGNKRRRAFLSGAITDRWIETPIMQHTPRSHARMENKMAGRNRHPAVWAFYSRYTGGVMYWPGSIQAVDEKAGSKKFVA